MALSGPLLFVTNHTPGSWWPTLIRGPFLPTLKRNKLHSRLLVVLSGPLLFVTSPTPLVWVAVSGLLLFVSHRIPVLVAFSGPFLSVVPPSLGAFWPTVIQCCLLNCMAFGGSGVKSKS